MDGPIWLLASKARLCPQAPGLLKDRNWKKRYQTNPIVQTHDGVSENCTALEAYAKCHACFLSQPPSLAKETWTPNDPKHH